MKQFISGAVIAALISCGFLFIVQTASADAPEYAFPKYPVASYGQPIPNMPYPQYSPMPYQQYPNMPYRQQYPSMPYQQYPNMQYQQYPPMPYQQQYPTTYQQYPNTSYQQYPSMPYQQYPDTAYHNMPYPPSPSIAYVNPAYGAQAPFQPSTPTQARTGYTRSEIRSMPITARPNRPGHFIGNTVRRRAGVSNGSQTGGR